ncbi:hypothetical protein FTUN_7589 [Frigoriglobus tundricola]|uniref:Uncharacterized protein n=1 Tax=Frigoriglobus tundricola TaxID=2774151 RepID=A0A6M5Z2L5_9BACT|nr:hypothetical protein FTUN_7589 [Frigoriglobus tundricola]
MGHRTFGHRVVIEHWLTAGPATGNFKQLIVASPQLIG